MLKYILTLILFFNIFFCSCTNYMIIPDNQRRVISEKYDGKEFWLKQSLYSGIFYDDDRYMMLNSKPFNELTYINTIDGDIILPPPSSSIVPAGTNVELIKIQWPTASQIIKRPLYSPKYTFWVYLKVSRTQFGKLKDDKVYVLLPPTSVRNKIDFDEWFDSVFGNKNSQAWVLSLKNNVRKAISNKKILLGMNYKMMVASLGLPDRVIKETIPSNNKKILRQVAVYGARTIILQNDKIVKK